MRTLGDMEARALRHLDGMRVNIDAMATDVLQLVAAIRAAQYSSFANEERKPGTPMPEFFRDIFK